MLKVFLMSLAACLVLVVHAAAENAAIPPNESTAETESIGKNESAPGKSPLIDILPPQYYPGTVKKMTTHDKVDKALDHVLRSADWFHDRRCAIGVVNEGKAKLVNPQWAMTSGKSHSALPKEVETGYTSLNLFYKTKGTARGTVGVLSYDIEGTDHKLVIFWMVPFDFNLLDVKFNMKVYTRNIGTNNNLANHLKKDGGPFAPNGWHSRTEYGVSMRGTITDNAKGKLIVWVNADGFNSNGGFDLFTRCAYHPGRVRKMCNQECYGGSWCWTAKKCKSAGDCAGRHACKGRC